MAKKRKTGRPLSRERVLRVAVTLADRGGVEGLSMRKLGEALGVEAMSLYKHVANKDDVLDGIVDLVVGEIELPVPGGDWRATLRRRAISAREVLLRHPWASLMMMSRVNVGPSMLRFVDATIGCLREAGFSYAVADHAWNAIDNHVHGFTLQEMSFPLAPGKYREAAQAHLPMIPADRYPHLNGLAQEVAAGRHDGLHDFEFGLDLILDGLERLRAHAD